MVEIRLAQASDADELYDLGKLVPEFAVSPKTVNFWPKETLMHALGSNDVAILVACENTIIIGFILATYNEGLKKSTIENVFVAPKFRGAQVGDALLGALIQNLADRGCEYITTLVPSEAAVSLYTQAGFSEGKTFTWLDKILSTEFQRPQTDV